MEEKRLGLAYFYQQQIVEELVMKRTVGSYKGSCTEVWGTWRSKIEIQRLIRAGKKAVKEPWQCMVCLNISGDSNDFSIRYPSTVRLLTRKVHDYGIEISRPEHPSETNVGLHHLKRRWTLVVSEVGYRYFCSTDSRVRHRKLKLFSAHG